MRKHDWAELIRKQANSGQTIAAFCAARSLTPSKFYAERAKQTVPTGLVPICVETELRITLERPSMRVVICGSAHDLAQVLRCL